jgi:tRNA dimethylallyltransferase
VKLALYPEDRAWLHTRIATRFRQMLDADFLDEARALFSRNDLAPELPSLRTVGYRQAGLYLSEKINYHEMIEQAIAATRQLARRQMTWLRSDTGAFRIDCSAEEDLTGVARRHLFARLSL